MPDGIPIHIGNFSYTIHFYGIILMLGAVAGAVLARSEAKRRQFDPEIIWDILIYLLIGGIIGARLWHIFSPPPTSLAQGVTTSYYLSHPLAAIAVWNGGLGIPGAVIGGGLVMYYYARKHQLDFATWADIAAPGVALGQAIGRWGNFFNQELYGAPTNLPWAIFIDPQHRMAGFADQAYYHPLFLYESLCNLANMLVLLWLGRRFRNWLKPGDLFPFGSNTPPLAASRGSGLAPRFNTIYLYTQLCYRTVFPGFSEIGCFPSVGNKFQPNCYGDHFCCRLAAFDLAAQAYSTRTYAKLIIE